MNRPTAKKIAYSTLQKSKGPLHEKINRIKHNELDFYIHHVGAGCVFNFIIINKWDEKEEVVRGMRVWDERGVNKQKGIARTWVGIKEKKRTGTFFFLKR